MVEQGDAHDVLDKMIDMEREKMPSQHAMPAQR
jgi:hypothetical protein